MGPILPHARAERRGTFDPRNSVASGGVVADMPITGEYVPSPDSRTREQVELYERSGGTRGTTMRGMPVVVLTMLGASSGKVRKIPLMRVEHDGAYAAVASLGGAPQHPVWYRNLLAHPRLELQDGPAKGEYVAREVTGAERDLWWERAVAAYPDYADYQTRTDRVIPVLVLAPVAPGAGPSPGPRPPGRPRWPRARRALRRQPARRARVRRSWAIAYTLSTCSAVASQP
jgi:deazaflavin-dependent oxidoreductase (nitroreductase family)